MNTYTCPTCNEKIERDLIVFMKHTDEHIIEAIRKSHPEWVSDKGICGKCLDYFKRAMGKG